MARSGYAWAWVPHGSSRAAQVATHAAMARRLSGVTVFFPDTNGSEGPFIVRVGYSGYCFRKSSRTERGSPGAATFTTSANPIIYNPYEMTKKHTHQKMIGPEAPSKSTVLNFILMGPVVYCSARTSVNERTALKAAPVMGMKLDAIVELNHILTP